MIEKKSAHDKSKSNYTIGAGKSKSNSKRAGTDKPQEFEVTSGWPKGGYDKDGARLKHDNPSHEGEAWFQSQSFNDVESNKRPLHPDKDYLNPHDEQTSDDHIEKHGMEGKDKVNWSENPNNDTTRHKKGGFLKVKNDGWTGNDHLNKKLEVGTDKEDLPLVGYAPINRNLEKKPNIYNINENIKDMKKFNEQIERIQQMILFEEGMSFKDVQRLTEGHGDDGFEAADPPSQPGVMTGEGGRAFTTTWSHSVGDGLSDAPENIYAVYTQGGRAVEPNENRGVFSYDADQFAQAADTDAGGGINIYRGVSGKEGLTYTTPSTGIYGLSNPTNNIVNVSRGTWGGTSANPWYWGTHGETASDAYGVQYASYPSEADYTTASQSAADAQSWWGQAGHTRGQKGEVGKVMSDYPNQAAYNSAVWAQQDTNLTARNKEIKARTIRKGPKAKSGLGSGAVGAPFGSQAAGGKGGKGKGKGKTNKAGSGFVTENKKIMKNRKVIKLTEQKLRRVIERAITERPKKLTIQERIDKQFADARNVLREHRGHLFEKDWMQKVDKDIEKRGTEGVFHKWCVDHGYKDGCSKGCWDEAKDKGGVWGRRAGLAKAYCESN
tara:strand:- start:392 stop:2212 length:1821 start_codon:yes stop_codon:yes gene_type:complete